MDQTLQALLESDTETDRLLADLMAVLGRALDCDRCILFLRDPHSWRGRATHAWQRRPEFALARLNTGWQPQPKSLPKVDPLFEAALRDPEALFIEDVLTADPALVNKEFELAHFRHRALVHAPLYHEGLLYGVLEPCVMAKPRRWSATDRETIAAVQAKISPMAADYVARHCR